MRKVIIENEVVNQLVGLRQKLITSQGMSKGENTFQKIISSIDNLGIYSTLGRNIKIYYNVDCPDNWYLLTSHRNYFVFSKTEELITVLKMYDEKQDFINDLFGISMRSRESIDYWKE